jgi:hypothetical protein
LIITKVYGPDGNLLRIYPNAFAEVRERSTFIWATALAVDMQKKDTDGYLIDTRNKNINTGNWLACISGPAVIIEERLDEDSPTVHRGEANS